MQQRVRQQIRCCFTLRPACSQEGLQAEAGPKFRGWGLGAGENLNQGLVNKHFAAVDQGNKQFS